jgi:hypothetical protein
MDKDRREELKATMKWAEDEMKKSDFDPFSDHGSWVTFKWSDAKKQLDENPEEIVDPATIGRGTGELFGFRFELD